ncbi:hypothetical protein [Mucilaginibacter sp.]|uniref:hypothetical protein n=1 Tax=Mucilaginibacter sp. TaxID=1882438 RepID=UPI00262EB5BC|nr:hypothetical protein [Mucilaginibacter sp.]MDB4918489.1 hypothetical protein [Mucilaginibacter sp.]
MKKILTLLSFVLLLLLSAGMAQAQIIYLNVNASGETSIWLDKTSLYKDNINQLPIKGTNGFKIKLTNLSGSVAEVVIKGRDDLLPRGTTLTPLSIADFGPVLTSMNTLTTDEKLYLFVNSHSYNLKQPFSIIFGLKNQPATTFTANFIPVDATGTPADVAAAPAAQPLVSNPNPAGANNGATAKKNEVYHPGSAVYDALKLNDPTLTQQQLLAIIGYYYPGQTIQTPANAVSAVVNNPFLKPLITQAFANKAIKPDENVAQSASAVSSALSLSSIGGLDVTNLADGLAKFLVKRAKEELSAAFFVKLKKAINDQPDLKTLFPKTTDLLNSIDDQVYNYQQYLQNLREAFKNDIEALDNNLPGIIRNHATYFAAQHTLAAGITGGCYVVSGLRKQVHPGDILANYPLSSLDKEPEAWEGSIQTLQLLSSALRDTSSADAKYWVNIKYMRQLVADKKNVQLFLGLIYEQAKTNYNSISYGGGKSLVSLLNDFGTNHLTDAAKFDVYKAYLLQFAEKTDALNKMIQDYQKPANDSLAVEQYKKYFDGAKDLLVYALKVTDLPDVATLLPATTALKTDLPRYLTLLGSVSDLAVDINRKNYSSAINQLLVIYNAIYTKPLTADLAVARTALGTQTVVKAADITLQNRGTFTVEQVSYAEAVRDMNEAKSHQANLVRYGAFMAAIATAKTSDQVEQALESFVLPAGSSSIKRESPFNVSLNAYTGLFLGYEQIQDVPSSFHVNSWGLTAPVGVAISLGEHQFFPPFKNGHSSTSLFISLIDVGAVAAYRFKDNQTAQVPKIELKNIFSPGVFLSLGIPKTPLSLNFGVQSGPNLREINNENTVQPADDASNKLYWRFSASLVVDIPLLNFYTKSK